MDTELLQEYLVESRELLDAAQENVLRLEANPTDDAALAAIFRAFHTIKGGAGYLEVPHLVAWAHTLEGLLDKLRSRALPVTSPRIDAILQGIDIIHSMFAELSEEKIPSPGPPALAATIRSFAGGDATAANYPDAPKLSSRILTFPNLTRRIRKSRLQPRERKWLRLPLHPAERGRPQPKALCA